MSRSLTSRSSTGRPSLPGPCEPLRGGNESRALADCPTVARTRGMWLTLVAMTLASSMILVDQAAVPLASPDVVQGLGGNIADGQWILTANILPLAAFMVLGGRLGDLFGLRRVFLTGAVVFAVATALAAAAQSMAWIISMRVLQGSAGARRVG